MFYSTLSWLVLKWNLLTKTYTFLAMKSKFSEAIIMKVGTCQANSLTKGLNQMYKGLTPRLVNINQPWQIVFALIFTPDGNSHRFCRNRKKKMHTAIHAFNGTGQVEHKFCLEKNIWSGPLAHLATPSVASVSTVTKSSRLPVGKLVQSRFTSRF